MYLSRLILNPANRRVQSEIARPYEMHRSILRAFPEQMHKKSERVLFRLETNSRGSVLPLLIQSWGLPDWSWLDAPQDRGYLLPVDGPNPAVKPFNPHLNEGLTLAFRLLANPTIKTKRDGRPVRQGVMKEEDQAKWMHRKAEAGGFRVLSVQISRQSLTPGGTIHREQAKHKTRFLSIQFDGILQVAHPDRFLQTLKQGVGSGKGFGFGLLSIAPASRPHA